ncbi:MAG: PA domain-containing protein [Bacteroidota bacterium]
MKTLRYCLIALLALVLAPSSAFAQDSSDSLNVVVEGGDTYASYGISFGTAFEEDTNVGPLPIVLAEPDIGCAEDPDNPDADPLGFVPSIDNPEEVEGNIVLIYRGSCQFSTKVRGASAAGAAAVIIGSTVDDVPNFGGDCDPLECTIPATAVTMTVRDALTVETKFGSNVTIVPINITPQVFPPPPSTVGTHETGEIVFSVYDYGFLGSNANFAAEGDGEPFAFIVQDDTTQGGLFVSSVLVAQGGIVNTNPYTGAAPEFVNVADVAPIGSLPDPFDQGFTTSYDSEELGVSVTQRSYSRTGDSFVIVELEVRNTSGSAIDDAYIGIFADWDIVDADDPPPGSDPGASQNDSGGYNEDLALPYVFDDTMTQYYGVTAIGVDGLSGYSTDATTADDDQLFAALTGDNSPIGDPAERAAVTGTGPYDIGAGASVTVRFAYVAGTTEAELFANATEARMFTVDVEETTQAGTFRLESAYPNPFSSKTTIGFDLPTAQDVSLVVYDVLGREVATLIDGVRQAGLQTVEFDAASLPSGVYVYRLTAGATQLSEQVTVVR